MRDIDIDDRQAVLTIAGGLVLAALALWALTAVLKFRFVFGVGD